MVEREIVHLTTPVVRNYDSVDTAVGGLDRIFRRQDSFQNQPPLPSFPQPLRPLPRERPVDLLSKICGLDEHIVSGLLQTLQRTEFRHASAEHVHHHPGFAAKDINICGVRRVAPRIPERMSRGRKPPAGVSTVMHMVSTEDDIARSIIESNNSSSLVT